MRFEWDEAKRIENLKKHGLDFRDAHKIFGGEVYTKIDNRFDYGETRFYSIGLLNGVAVVIVHTETTIAFRIISFRRAKSYEEREYFSEIRN